MEYKYVLRRNLLSVIGFSLCLYFSYHLVHGERSGLRLFHLEKRIERLSGEYAALSAEREGLERKVVMLRPGSINRDLLEERARDVLGFVHRDERILFESSH